MKKQFLRTLVVVMLVLGWAVMSWAGPILNDDEDGIFDPIDTFADGSSYGLYTNSGELLGIEKGNNDGDAYPNANELEALVEGWMGFTVDEANSFTLSATPDVFWYGEDGTTLADDTSKTGTWEVKDTIDAISFYAVKAGKYFAMYLEDPASATGSWSTFDLWDYGQENDLKGLGGNGGLQISHFTGYNPGDPIPEPATVLLLGFGLVGLATVGRRRMKKQ
jgi:hypothetical protein